MRTNHSGRIKCAGSLALAACTRWIVAQSDWQRGWQLSVRLETDLSATTPAKGNRIAAGSTRMTTMPDTSRAEEPPRRWTSVMQET